MYKDKRLKKKKNTFDQITNTQITYLKMEMKDLYKINFFFLQVPKVFCYSSVKMTGRGY